MTATNPIPLDGMIRVDFEATSTTDTYGHGRRVQTDQGPLVWAKAAAATTEGQIAKMALVSSILTGTLIDTTISASEATAIGAAHKAIASASYGWWFEGPFQNVQVLLATTISADALITTTATAGTGGAGGDTINGLNANASSGSGGLTYSRAVCKMVTNV